MIFHSSIARGIALYQDPRQNFFSDNCEHLENFVYVAEPETDDKVSFQIEDGQTLKLFILCVSVKLKTEKLN